MGKYNYDERMRNEIAEQILEAVENLALMTQREFVALRQEMQEMREELRGEFRTEMQATREEIRKDIQAGREALYNKLHGEIEELRQEMRQELRANFAPITGMVANHEFRIERVEKKLDIS